MTRANDTPYQNPYERAFDGRMNPDPLLKGINSKQTALMAHRAAHKYNSTTEEKERIAEMLRRFSDE